ncbi:alpha/beta hydrolase [Corynebacterium caspium]|uniref:alpha/beta hydrolase n=1 Tax=Corynebacterium caspium TaxID=234828 RepID=UPI000377E79C|nr:alpha/beta hydrolase [Corynebacterium caspium]WKD58636.1 hypothetical protein CCASP_01050 [Corynebacterium caspium DSM 44850]
MLPPKYGISAASWTQLITELEIMSTKIRQTAESAFSDIRALEHSGILGISFKNGLDSLKQHPQHWQRTAQEISQVIQVLQRILVLEQNLEQFAVTIRSHQGLRQIVDPTLASLGQALDFACAREILSLCTLPSLPGNLGARADLSPAALHELVLLEHPEFEELAARFPQAIFLDASSDGSTIIAAFGDIDTASAITTVVAGVNSSQPDSWSTQFARAQAVQPAGGAAIAWLGYKAPNSLAEGTRNDPARSGAKALQVFQRDIAARNPRARKVVVGYSYGSVVAGYAAKEQLIADDLVLVGSPGVPAQSAQDFNLEAHYGRGLVHAITSPKDHIGYLSGEPNADNSNPVDPAFGAKIWRVPPVSHSKYWDTPEFVDIIRGIAQKPDT